MYYHIETIKNQFKHFTESRLLFGVAVADKRAVLFYANGMYFDYELYSQKIFYSGNLSDQPYKAIYIHPNQIIILMSGIRRLLLMDLTKREITSLRHLPIQSSGDQGTDKNIFYTTNIHAFKNSQTFYLQETSDSQNKKRLYFFFNAHQSYFIMKQFDDQDLVFEKINEKSQIAIYKQKIETENVWEMKILDLADNFHETKFILNSPAFTIGSFVAEVIAKDDKIILIFLKNRGGVKCEILEFDVQNNCITEFPYKLDTNFKQVCFYNRKKELACISYFAHVRVKGQLYQNMIELVDMDKKIQIQKKYLNLKDYSLGYGWEQEYFLDIASQYKEGNISIFHSRHFIKKNSLYLNLMHKTGILKKFGEEICHYTLDLLHQQKK